MTDHQIASHALKVADDLELLLAGRLTPEAFRTKYSSREQPDAVIDSIASVEHFLSDGDIRARDSGYRVMQEREMQKLIDYLREGRLDAAGRITFLSPRDEAK